MNRDILVSIGEALIDFIPDKSGCEFYEVSAFSPMAGGAPANVCAAYSKLGGCSRIITQLGNDPFGHKIIRELKKYGIDTSAVSLTDRANTALAFVSLDAAGERTFSFYRKPSADMLLEPQQLEPAWFEDIYALHFCSVSLGDFPMRQAHVRAIELARQNGAVISFDPNLRFPLWEDIGKLAQAVKTFIPKCDILKISDEELEFISGENDIEKALPALFEQGVRLIIYTCGGKGAYAYIRQVSAYSAAQNVQVADTTGAGDGFVGAFLYKLCQNEIHSENIEHISREMLCECLDFCSRFCAVSVTRRGAMDSYPTPEEI